MRMSRLEALADLRRVGGILTTSQAAAVLQATPSAASKALSALATAGQVERVRSGLWAIDPVLDPRVLVAHLTDPAPGYVSLWSGLAYHGMMDQIPQEIYVASTGRPQRVATSRGVFSVHRVAPALYGGFETVPSGALIALPEKALFDTVYILAIQGRGAHALPEIEVPDGFSHAGLDHWVARVGDPRLRARVDAVLDAVLGPSRAVSVLAAAERTGRSVAPARAGPR